MPQAVVMVSCVLCGASRDRLTDEDVIPKWAVRALNVQGPITIGIREEAAEQQHVGTRSSGRHCCQTASHDTPNSSSIASAKRWKHMCVGVYRHADPGVPEHSVIAREEEGES